MAKGVRANRVAGVEPTVSPQSFPRPEVSEADLLALRRAGLRLPEIAARVGLTPRVLADRFHKLRKQGVDLPPLPRGRPPGGGFRPGFGGVSDEQIVAHLQQGRWVREIAAQVGMSLTGVRYRLQALQRRGLFPAPPTKREPTISDSEVLALCQAGLRAPEIAARLGLTAVAVRGRFRTLRKQGVDLPPWVRRGNPRGRSLRRASHEQLLRHLAEGLPVTEIAARLGMTRAGVYLRLKALRQQGLVSPTLHAQRRHVPDAELLALRAAGLRNPEIAAQVGLKAGGVGSRFTRLRRRGVVIPPLSPDRPLQGTPEAVLALARTGLGHARIARELGISKTTVGSRLRALRAQGCLPPSRLARWADLDGQIQTLCRAGLQSSEIAARLGLRSRVVRVRLRLLRGRGVPLPQPTGPRPHPRRRVSDEQVLAFLAEGLRVSEIAARVGVRRESVHWRLRALRRRGVLPPRSPRGRGQPKRPAVLPEELARCRAHPQQALREQDIICLECGGLYRLLKPHLRRHGLSAAAYRKKWRYRRDQALLASASREQRRRRGMARMLPPRPGHGLGRPRAAGYSALRK